MKSQLFQSIANDFLKFQQLPGLHLPASQPASLPAIRLEHLNDYYNAYNAL